MRSPLFFPLSCCILRASPMTKVQFGYASLTAAVCFSFLSFCAGSASPKSNAIAHWAECTEKRTEVLLMLLPDCALTEADQLKLAAAPSPSGLLVCLPWPLGRSKRKRVSSWLFCCSSPFRCLFIESNVLVCVCCVVRLRINEWTQQFFCFWSWSSGTTLVTRRGMDST